MYYFFLINKIIFFFIFLKRKRKRKKKNTSGRIAQKNVLPKKTRRNAPKVPNVIGTLESPKSTSEKRVSCVPEIVHCATSVEINKYNYNDPTIYLKSMRYAEFNDMLKVGESLLF